MIVPHYHNQIPKWGCLMNDHRVMYKKYATSLPFNGTFGSRKTSWGGQPTKNMTSQKASMIRNRVQIGHNFDCLEPAPQLFHLYACYCYKLWTTGANVSSAFVRIQLVNIDLKDTMHKVYVLHFWNVTRLGNFLTFSAINFLTKIAQIFTYYFVITVLGNFCEPFYSKIWSHCI